MSEKEISDLREKIALLDKELEDKNLQLSKSNEEQQQQKNRITFLKGQLKENEEVNEELAEKYQTLSNDFDTSKLKLNEMTRNCQLLSNESEKKTLEIATLKKLIEEKNSLIIDLKREITSLRKEAEKSRTSKFDASNQMSSFTVTNPLLRTTSESIERNRDAQHSQINIQSSIVIDKNNNSLAALVDNARRFIEFEDQVQNDDSVILIEEENEEHSKIISSSNQNKPLIIPEVLILNKNLASSTPTQPERVNSENQKDSKSSISQIIEKNLAACFFVDNKTNRIRLNEKILNQNLIDQILEIICNRKQVKNSTKLDYDASDLKERCIDSFQILLDYVFDSLISYANLNDNFKAQSINEFALIISCNEYICLNFESIANDIKEIIGASDLESLKQDGFFIIRIGSKFECESVKQKIESKLLALDNSIRLVVLDEIFLFTKKLAEIILRWLPTFCVKSERQISITKFLVSVTLEEKRDRNFLARLVLDDSIYWKVDRTILHKFLAFIYFYSINEDLTEVERIYTHFLRRFQQETNSKPQIKLEEFYYNESSREKVQIAAAETRKNNGRFSCPFCSKQFLITISYKPYKTYYNHKCLEKKLNSY